MSLLRKALELKEVMAASVVQTANVTLVPVEDKARSTPKKQLFFTCHREEKKFLGGKFRSTSDVVLACNI